MSKVSIIGAGNVGASCAEYIAMKNFAAEVVLLDIKENFAEGKALDLMQTAALNGFDTKISGSTNDYSKTANSDVIVITSGIPRKPGMTRENYGKWHIDHIRPCSSFDLSKPEEQSICFHYSNLMPLWAEENLKKGSKLNYEEK